MPEGDMAACAEHATKVGSGRVGRSTVADDPVYLAVRAYARHSHTDYDEILDECRLMDGLVSDDDRDDARKLVAAGLDELLARWASVPDTREGQT